MTYRAALDALAERQEHRMRFGLARLRRVLRRLGDPHRAVPCLHAAGTNGKGSTCAILESVLRAAGYRTGLYLSPHVECLRERIQVRGRPISEPLFARLLGRVIAADSDRELTYFELLTCAAFLHFREQAVQVAVLETGLGGRLDATNVVPRPLACVITSISFDHMQWLGATLRSIASEKAGIIKPRVPVFCPRLPGEAMEVLAAKARSADAPLTAVRRSWKTISVDWRRNRQVVADGPRQYELSLLGARQGRNAALAKAVLDRVLPVGEDAWREGLRRVRLPGRCEVISRGGKTAVVDGAHNPEAVGELASILESWPGGRGRVRWIVGLMKDKDKAAIVRRLAPLLADVVATSPRHPRALAADELARELRLQAPRSAVRVEADAGKALRGWLRDPAAPRVAVICGSFYLAGEALRALRGGRHS